MNGPEHYRMAECILEQISSDQSIKTSQALARAQVHATLAQAAATAMAAIDETGMHPDDFRAWDETCGVKPSV